MAQSRTRKAADEAAEDSRRRHRRAMISTGIAVIVVAFVCGWAGWLIKGATTPKHAVTVLRTFHGTVSFMSGAGSPKGICVRPDGGARQVCSTLYTALPVHIGDQVYAAHEMLHLGHGNGQDLLLLYTNPPS